MSNETTIKGERAITVTYTSVDYVRKVRTFRTLTGARTFAQAWIGANAETSDYYAVSWDGVGKIEVRGTTIASLFCPAAYIATLAADFIRAGGKV